MMIKQLEKTLIERCQSDLKIVIGFHVFFDDLFPYLFFLLAISRHDLK